MSYTEDMLARYRKNYIKEMRKDVGHAPLMGTACGVIIENDKGEILLQKRRDNGCWGILGGAMEIGEKFAEVARREVLEEAGITIGEMELFGIYSREDRIITYPNGDICCVTSIVFRCKDYQGEIQDNTDEALEHRFFDRENIPDNINEFDKRYLADWVKNPQHVIVD